MACQDESLDALIEYVDEHEGEPNATLSLRTCAQAGALPPDCLAAAGLGELEDLLDAPPAV